MKVFLTSSPCLEGHADINPANEFLSRLMAAVGPMARAVFVTANPEDQGYSDYCASSMRHSMEISGLTFASFDLLDGRNVNDAVSLVGASNFIILGGGHVPTQNHFLFCLGLKELLQNYKGVVMGISAGSMNLAEEVYAQPEEPGESGAWYQRFIPGMAVTQVNICPHLQKVRYNELDGQRLFEDITFGDSHGHSFYALPDGSYVFQADGQATLFGEGYLIRDGQMTCCCKNDQHIIIN